MNKIHGIADQGTGRDRDSGWRAEIDPLDYSRRAMTCALIVGAILGALLGFMGLCGVGAMEALSTTRAREPSVGELAAFCVTGAIVGMILANVIFRLLVGLSWAARQVIARRQH